MKQGDLFAVYGLLRRGESGYIKYGLTDASEFVAPCVIDARLYDFGRHPAVLPGGGDVVGELFRLVDEAVVPLLDEFEDYDPLNEGPWDPATETGSRYLRRRVKLKAPDETAWVYLWNGDVEGAPLIAHGDWLKR